MDNKIIDAETGEIVPAAPIIFIPSPQDALDAWNAYQELCQKLLNESDYAVIKGKKARKRTGWAKLRRALNISTQIIAADWQEFEDHECGYEVTIRASFPDGRFEDGDGYCDSYELKGNIAPTRHNIRAKAITRAKNRATADLIGSGEVSAEEFVDDEAPAVHTAKPRRQPAKQANGNGTIDFPTAPPGEFLKYINDQVQVPYDGLPHLVNALKQEGHTGAWPDAKRNPDWWLKAKALAIQHANAKAA